MDEMVDADKLRRGVREKYREVALDPQGSLGSYTGRPLAAKLGYPSAIVDAMPDRAVESFAGVNNPFSLRDLQRGERAVNAGSGRRVRRVHRGPTGRRSGPRGGR